MKRIFDILISLIGLIFLLPFLTILAVLVKLSSKGPVFYKQIRIGKNEREFSLLKFRTMYVGSDKIGLLTVGDKDKRVTSIGYHLRKHKLDELPQLFNVLMGDMSLVGPRPEVKKYVSLYNDFQRKVLSVKPGITDYASIHYMNENELLAQTENPEYTYITKIMPAKLEMNLRYIKEQGLLTDIKIILKTISKIFQ